MFVRPRAVPTLSLQSDVESQAALLSYTDPSKGSAKLFIDADETFIYDKGSAVGSIAIENDFGELLRTTRTADLLVKALTVR